MSVTFYQLLSQARVTMDKKGLYLIKSDRTCEASARVFVAVRAALDNDAQGELKSEKEKTTLAKEISRLASELAEAQREIQELNKTCFKRGLEGIPEIAQATRERLLNVNGG